MTFWQNQQGSGKIWVELVIYCYHNLIEVVYNLPEKGITPIVRWYRLVKAIYNRF